MPKSKNNVSRSPFRDSRSHREHSHESSFIQSAEDSRSKEEKVSDLTDLFVGDYFIDAEIIHGVLEECNWNVEDATEKLFEVFFNNTQPAKSSEKESNDLATIAVSILMDKRSSTEKSSDSEREGCVSNRNMDFNLAGVAGDVNNKSSAINQKQNNNLRPKVSTNENLIAYNNSTKISDVKPSTESKTVFESKSSQHNFYNKNSFGDMAVNMEHYDQHDSSLPKALNTTVIKEEIIPESNNSLKSMKTKPRFDLSKVSVNDSPSTNKIEINCLDEKNNSLFYTDKSMESLFSGGHSPSTSMEWDSFYKQLNLQPLQTEKVYPEISVNSDTPSSFPVMSKIKSPTTQSKSSSFLNLAKADSPLRLQIPKSVSKDHFDKQSSPTDKGLIIENNLVLSNETNNTESGEKQSPTKTFLSPEAPIFMPRIIDSRQPMTRKSPAKQTKSQKKSLSNENKVSSPEKTPKFKRGKDLAHLQKQSTNSKNTEFMSSSSGLQVEIIDPMDPLGWKEIKSMTSSKAHKNDFKLNTKLLSHNHNFNVRLDNNQTKSDMSKSDKDISDDKTAVVPPFNYKTTLPANKNKTPTGGKKKDRFPKPNITGDSNTLSTQEVSMHSSNSESSQNSSLPINRSQSQSDNSFTHLFPSGSFQETPTLSLPPSLRGKPNLDQFSNILPQRVDSKHNIVPNRIVPKGDSNEYSDAVANKVQFVGVKSPMGKLKHYIDKKQPVMIILRGLPGSGKSFLAGQLVSECQRFNIQATSLSSDAYFTLSGQYNFNWQQLSEAHNWNKQRAQQCLKSKHPVIIIDNTNTTLWEMMPYAEMAILNSYDIQVCEPDTHWKNKVPELTRRNQHGVTRDHIKRMKDRYEHVTTDDILREASKSLKAKNKLPSHCNTTDTTTDQPIKGPIPQHKPRDQPNLLSSHLGNVPSPSSKPKLNTNSTEDDIDKETSSSLDQGLTQWLPAMEQRETTKKSKRTGRVEKQADTPREITLDFLNNSIKKAMVDMDKVDRETEMKDEQDNLQQENVQKYGSKILNEERKKKSDMEKMMDVKSLETELFDDHYGDQKSKEGADNEDIKPELESVAASNPSCRVTVLGLPSTLLDNSGSTGELYYSCGSEDGEDLKEQKLKTDGENERDQKISHEQEQKKKPATVLKNLDEMHHTLSDLSLSTEEFVSLEKEDLVDGISSDLPATSLDSVNIISTEENQLLHAIVTDGSFEKASSDSSHSEFILKPKKKETGEDNMTASINKKHSDEKTEVSVLQKNSLVVYSDSEEEEEEKDKDDECVKEFNHKISKASSISNIEEDKKNTIKDKPSQAASDSGMIKSCEGTVKEALDENGTNQPNEVLGNSDLEIEVITDGCVENSKNIVTDNALKERDSTEDGFTIKSLEDTIPEGTSAVKENSPESNSSTRDPSPEAASESLGTSYIKKKKKKKVKPVINTQGPFLEDSLKEKSKTENWSSFIINHSSQNFERQLSPTKSLPQTVVVDAGSQCESYYFSMVYRLNSKAFSHQQPIDISNCDVIVMEASSGGEGFESNDKVVQRKSETTDRSTITDEALVSEEVDLDTLQNCFPEYSRKQLEDVMAVCQNNLEWVSNQLLDSPPLVEYDEEEEEENEEEEDNKSSSKLEVKYRHLKVGTNSVKSLAQLCHGVVQNSQILDPDDFEQQVIDAGQSRLQEIENFAWVRLHSSSSNVDPSQSATGSSKDFWPDDFDLEACTGVWSGQEESGSESSVMKDFNTPVALKLKSPLRHRGARTGTEDSETNQGSLFPSPDPRALSPMQPAPILPLDFLRSLETRYGSLNVDWNESGFLLDDSTARKIYNSLKLQVSKKHVQAGPDHDKQMREDEAMARALHEAEMTSHDSSVQGWTNQSPTWMSKNTSPQSSSLARERKSNSAQSNPARLNSVSDTLHSLRGAWPKRLKPYKFRSKIQIQQRQQDSSVWTSKTHSRLRVDNMNAIMEEEKARETRMKQILESNQATGNTDVLATKIKRAKLSQMFPFLPPDVLEEIFMNNNYNLEMTVICLESQYDHKPVHVMPEQEEEKLKTLLWQNLEVSEDIETASFDDLRKEAQFYNDLANECRQKAQRHHGEGMHHVAFFYRQEVKKYLSEKDEANQRAARLLFDKGSERLLRENTLDLHSYHMNEAIEAVNLALEIKKEEYKSQSDRKRGYLTIITGRGRNSKWGIPKLKPAIINHLNNKNFRYEETAPGMFKVHIFQE